MSTIINQSQIPKQRLEFYAYNMEVPPIPTEEDWTPEWFQLTMMRDMALEIIRLQDEVAVLRGRAPDKMSK